MPTPPSRGAFRAHPLDGAMLYFHAASGTHVRVENATTRALQRQAPRVAMFGITNRCNLRCGFCSRDTARTSDWTPGSAAQVLRGLAEAGTLEVAFGGGEPFAFRGFDDLVAELHATTALALNVTTNGTLLNDAMFARFKGRLGQVRVSLYEDAGWRRAGEVLAGHGQRWGANVMVDDALLPGLPALLGELAWRGCADVSLLSYVGPEPHRHLSPQGRTRLAAVIAASPVPCRVSVCLGDSVPVPRLFDGPGHTGDCDAGLDFVSITPDRRMQACSFQDGGLPAASAAEVLHGWRHARARLRAPSLRTGCARARRPRTAATATAPLPPVAVWQAFSGNNSGECVMVARFDTAQAAEAYLDQLLPHWEPDADCPPEWRTLFKAHGLSKPLAAMEETPTGLLALGRAVIATGYAADDVWAPLRALAWKQDAQVLPGGIHLHDHPSLLAAVRGRDSGDAQALAARPPAPAAETFVHGETVLAILPQAGMDALATARDQLVAWAGGRPLAGEALFEAVDRAAVTEVLKRLGTGLERCPRLVAHFWGTDGEGEAARFAQGAREDGVETAVAGGCVMLCGRQRWKRLVLRAYQLGGSVKVLEGPTLAVGAYLNLPADDPRLTEAQATAWHARLQGRLQAALPQGSGVSVTPSGRRQRFADVRLRLHSSAPVQALARIGEIARELNAADLWVSVEEVEALGFAVRRVMGDVRQVPV